MVLFFVFWIFLDLNKTLRPKCCLFFPKIPCCEKRSLLEFSPTPRNKFLMLHFFELYFKFLRFMLKYMSLIEIIWHIVVLQKETWMIWCHNRIPHRSYGRRPLLLIVHKIFRWACSKAKAEPQILVCYWGITS